MHYICPHCILTPMRRYSSFDVGVGFSDVPNVFLCVAMECVCMLHHPQTIHHVSRMLPMGLSPPMSATPEAKQSEVR